MMHDKSAPNGGGQIAVVAPSLTVNNLDSRPPQSEEQQRIVGAVHAASATVRRLTPEECERLQGFPDGWTLVPYGRRHKNSCLILRSESFDDDCDCGAVNRFAADGPRYRALGNSMAVPVVRWIGERLAEVEASDD